MLYLLSFLFLVNIFKVHGLSCNTGVTTVYDGISASLDTSITCGTDKKSCGIINTTYSYDGLIINYDYEYLQYGCANTSICDTFAGGVNQCTRIHYDYYEWVPSGSCNNGIANGYNLTSKYAINYACCQTNGCTDNYDYSLCTDSSNLQNYVSKLNTCWNQQYQVYVNEMYCQSKSIYTFSADCTTNGTWNGNSGSVSSSCYYQLTCTDDLIAILQDLADCGCQATVDYSMDNDDLEHYLSEYYSDWCSNVQVTCNGNKATLSVLYFYVKWSFVLNVAYSDINSTVKAQITASVASSAKVDSSTVTLEITANSGRRLLGSSTSNIAVTITTQDTDTATTVKNTVNQNPSSSYAGYNVVSSSSATTSNNQQTSDAKILSSGITIFIILLLVGLLN